LDQRAIIDAAMNLLGGGLRVRILIHGKKIIDEGATLLQTGISRNLKPESLGFMLEPSPIPTSPNATFEDPLLVLSRPPNQTSSWYSFMIFIKKKGLLYFIVLLTMFKNIYYWLCL